MNKKVFKTMAKYVVQHYKSEDDLAFGRSLTSGISQLMFEALNPQYKPFINCIHYVVLIDNELESIDSSFYDMMQCIRNSTLFMSTWHLTILSLLVTQDRGLKLTSENVLPIASTIASQLLLTLQDDHAYVMEQLIMDYGKYDLGFCWTKNDIDIVRKHRLALN